MTLRDFFMFVPTILTFLWRIFGYANILSAFLSNILIFLGFPIIFAVFTEYTANLSPFSPNTLKFFAVFAEYAKDCSAFCQTRWQ